MNTEYTVAEKEFLAASMKQLEISVTAECKNPSNIKEFLHTEKIYWDSSRWTVPLRGKPR